MTTTSTTPQPPRLEAVLAAAERVLSARQDQMLTVEEWAGLARAVAACTGRLTSELLLDRDLEEAAAYGLAWDHEADGPLPPGGGEGGDGGARP